MNLFCQRDRTDLDRYHNPYNLCHRVDGIIINEIEQTLNRCFNPCYPCYRVDGINNQRDRTYLGRCHNTSYPCHRVDEEQISEIGQALDGRRIHACVVTR